MKNGIFGTLIICGLIFGCTKKSTPEKTLKDFISYRFKDSQSRDSLVEMTTNPLRERISALEGKELEDFLNVKDLKRKKLKVLVKNCEGSTCFLTYVLGYGQGKSNPKEFGIEVKKIAKIEQIDKVWKISEVSNVKTYIEAKSELGVSSDGESTAP
jgi:hypothetical protein